MWRKMSVRGDWLGEGVDDSGFEVGVSEALNLRLVRVGVFGVVVP